MKRELDPFDLEAEAEAKAIARSRQLKPNTTRGKRSMGAKMNYRRSMAPTARNIDRIVGKRLRSA